jgi:hypothetical protein
MLALEWHTDLLINTPNLKKNVFTNKLGHWTQSAKHELIILVFDIIIFKYISK